MRRKHLTILSILVTVLTFQTAAMADSSWQNVQDKGEIVIGFCAQYPPFESKNEASGQFEGFDVDLGKALATQLGLRAKFVDAEWQGLLAGLKKGDFDVLLTCMSKSETRGQNVNFTDVYYKLPDVIVVNKENTAIKGKEDLKGKTVGVQLGSGSEQLVDTMKGTFKDIKRYNYNPEAFTDLKVGRIDAIVVGYAYAVTQIKQDPSFKVVGEPLAEAEIVMVLPKDADALTQKMNHALSEIKKDGTYQKIHDDWLKIY